MAAMDGGGIDCRCSERMRKGRTDATSAGWTCSAVSTLSGDLRFMGLAPSECGKSSRQRWYNPEHQGIQSFRRGGECPVWRGANHMEVRGGAPPNSVTRDHEGMDGRLGA